MLEIGLANELALEGVKGILFFLFQKIFGEGRFILLEFFLVNSGEFIRLDNKNTFRAF